MAHSLERCVNSNGYGIEKLGIGLGTRLRQMLKGGTERILQRIALAHLLFW